MLTYSHALLVSGAKSDFPPDVLPVSIKHQCMSNWCWAAVAELVSALLDNPPRSQCEIATASLSGKACCPCPDAKHPCNSACNTTHNIEGVLGPRLGAVSHSNSYPPDGPVIDFDTVSHEIGDSRRPIVCRVQLADGSGWHYVAIIGVITTTPSQIRICDPLMADGNFHDIPFDEFSHGYSGLLWDTAITIL
jgi:hypothetical protein